MSGDATTPGDVPVVPTTDRESHRRELRDIVAKSGMSLVLKVLGGAAGFAMSVVVGRQLGASEAGLFFLALTIVTLFSSVARCGYDQAVTRLVSEASSRADWSAINGLYRIVLTRTVFYSALIAVLTTLAAPWLCKSIFHDPALTPVVRIMSWAIVGFSVTWIHSHFFQGRNQIKRFQLFQNLGVVGTFLLILLFATLSPSNMTAERTSACFLAATVVMAVLSVGWWRTEHAWASWHSDTYCLKALRKIAMPMFGLMLITQCVTWLPQLSLGVFRPPSDVAVYSVAFRTANLVAIALMGVNSVVFPRFAALYAAGEMDRLREICQKCTLGMMVICVPFLMLLMAFPDQILYLFGNDFVGGGTSLRILCLGQVVNVATGSVGGLLLMTGHQHASLRCGILSLVTTVASVAMLVPPLGAAGAAIAQAVGVSVNMLSLSWFCTRTFGFSPLGWCLQKDPVV